MEQLYLLLWFAPLFSDSLTQKSLLSQGSHVLFLSQLVIWWSSAQWSSVRLRSFLRSAISGFSLFPFNFPLFLREGWYTVNRISTCFFLERFNILSFILFLLHKILWSLSWKDSSVIIDNLYFMSLSMNLYLTFQLLIFFDQDVFFFSKSSNFIFKLLPLLSFLFDDLNQLRHGIFNLVLCNLTFLVDILCKFLLSLGKLALK